MYFESFYFFLYIFERRDTYVIETFEIDGGLYESYCRSLGTMALNIINLLTI